MKQNATQGQWARPPAHQVCSPCTRATGMARSMCKCPPTKANLSLQSTGTHSTHAHRNAQFPDEFVRKHAATLVREVAKHTPELAQLVVANGGVGALVE